MSESEAGQTVPETDANVAEAPEGVEESTPQEPEQQEADRVQKRINKLTWEKHEAQRKNAELEERLKALEQKQTPNPADAVKDLEAPKFSDYSTDEEYAAALQDHNMQMFQRMQEQTQSQAEQARAEAERNARRDTYQQRMAEYVVENDGAIEAISAANIAISDAVEQVLLESTEGPRLTHWLAENPAEAIRINSLPPVLAAKELGRIEMTFESVAPKKVSSAPPPSVDLSGGDAESPGDLRDDMDIDDWMKKRRAQILEKRGRL